LSPTGVLIRWGDVGSPSIRSISAFPGEGITVGAPRRVLSPRNRRQVPAWAGGEPCKLRGPSFALTRPTTFCRWMPASVPMRT
jgi:hypothetical protein